MDPLSSRQVCRLTGVSYRQLDYWQRVGLISASVSEARGSGTQRRWSEDDVRRVHVLKQLMAPPAVIEEPERRAS